MLDMSRKGPGDLCAEALPEPLLSCRALPGLESEWSTELAKAMAELCADERNHPYMEIFLDGRFRSQYDSIYGSDGWAEEAWVNFVKVKEVGSMFGNLTRDLVDSVRRWSERPIVVVNFGAMAVPELDPAQWPNLVVLHARDLPGRGSHDPKGVSFNFNKLRALLLARVKVGVSVDSDMVVVNPMADRLFARTREEITRDYPFPMLPVHFLDRDPGHRSFKATNYLEYHCVGCPTPTLRWGQAHPTWNYWAFHFISRWLAARLDGRRMDTVEGAQVETASIGEDEDLLNVALWSEGATKNWCAFQMGGTDFLWQNYFPEHAPGPYPWYDDKVRFKKGVPIAFFLGHAERHQEDIDRGMKMLEERRASGKQFPKVYFHDMKFYDDFAALRAEHPDVNCTL